MTNSYDKLVKAATCFAIASALILITIKLLTWWVTGSMSLLASLIDSSIDLFASAMNFVLVRYALKPADEGHRFGHGKAESLSALGQSAFIVGSAVFLLLSSFKLLFNPVPVNQPAIGMIVSFISVVITLCLVLYQRHVVRITGSQAIKADMLHYFCDFLVNIAVMLALTLSWFGFIYADAIFAMLIGGYIFYSAIQIAYSSIQDLLDKALPESDNEKILDLASVYPEVHGIHDLKTRRAGQTTFVQLHIELDDNLPLIQSHAVADKIEQAIAKEFAPADVIIHQDPLSVVPKEKTKLRGKQQVN